VFIFFLEAINERNLYCAVPKCYQLPDLKIEHGRGYQHFINEYTFANQLNEIGLRISPTGFWYGESLDWAIVSDLTNFKADFSGQYFDIHQVIKNMEEANLIFGKVENLDFEFTKIDNKVGIIEQYS
jgi:hypothetical protein